MKNWGQHQNQSSEWKFRQLLRQFNNKKKLLDENYYYTALSPDTQDIQYIYIFQ